MNVWLYVLPAVLILVVGSNLWLLHEHEKLRQQLGWLQRQLDTYQNEVVSLDHQICRLMVDLEDEALRRGATKAT